MAGPLLAPDRTYPIGGEPLAVPPEQAVRADARDRTHPSTLGGHRRGVAPRFSRHLRRPRRGTVRLLRQGSRSGPAVITAPPTLTGRCHPMTCSSTASASMRSVRSNRRTAGTAVAAAPTTISTTAHSATASRTPTAAASGPARTWPTGMATREPSAS